MEILLPRTLDDLDKHIRPRRVLVIYGPRRVGKTTLVKNYLKTKQLSVLSVVGDDIRVRNILSSQDKQQILEWVSGYDGLFIDEAQRIPNIGWALKILIDARPDLSIIVTGSASFELAGKVGEPLTGRQVPIHLFPISFTELSLQNNKHEMQQKLNKLLIYGMYPEVITATNNNDREFILNELVSSYLLKDILEIERVKSTKILSDLLVMIALQVGSEVSLNELSSRLGIDVKTVARYLDLFEKSFVLYNLRGFSRNLRKEITRTSKYYFYDTGVRNAIIGNYSDLEYRDDVGALWENFVIIEKLKAREYQQNTSVRDYFWRTWDQKEIDLIEDGDNKLVAYEIKWSNKKKTKSTTASSLFKKTYPGSKFRYITPDNLAEFL